MNRGKIDNAAIIAAANYDNPFDEPAYDKKFYDGFMAGVDWLMQQQQWQPFSSENSPYVGQEVLILGETGDMILAKIIERPIKPFGHTLVWHPEVKCKVTHWMPIPEPPINGL